MKLGAFSVSLSVKDLQHSITFYEKLGFSVFAGDKKNYVIMKNGNALIGLFQGMFQGNILTFNPGWDENAANVDPFDDVRKIEQHVKEQGVILTSEVSTGSEGPGSITMIDPDGNMILIDQHR
jgi:predicted lactoylglutathione lyase